MQLHFAERKYRVGNLIPASSFGEMKRACRSDVRQTFDLWKCISDGSLIVNGSCPYSMRCPFCGGNSLQRFYPHTAWDEHKSVGSMPWRCAMEAKISICTHCFLVVNNIFGKTPEPTEFWSELWSYTIWIRRQINAGNLNCLLPNLFYHREPYISTILSRRKKLGFSEREPPIPSLLKGMDGNIKRALQQMKRTGSEANRNHKPEKVRQP